MSVNIPITLPSYPWNSAYKDIIFGFDLPLVKTNISSVADDGNGKAKVAVNLFGTVAGCKCDRLYFPSGPYAGFQAVTDYDYSSLVGVVYYYLEADFTSTYSGDCYCMPNMTYRLWHGWPTQEEYIDINVYYNTDGAMYVNLAKFLQSTFTIQPPVPGVDPSMFTHFKVEVIGNADWDQYLTDLGYDIEYLTEYDWTAAANKWYCLNGTVDHDVLNNNHTNSGQFLADEEPIMFNDHCVLYSIIAGIDMDEVHNVFTCLGAAAEYGIGYWSVEEDLIVS